MKQEDVKTIDYFVASLSEKEAREQLSLAYQQMELCIEMLNGKQGVKPVIMKDNGLSSDLELFYHCKKVVDGKNLKSNVGVEVDESINNLDKVKSSLGDILSLTKKLNASTEVIVNKLEEIYE